MKDAKRAMNYEDAIRKGLDIKSIRHLFIVNIAAIVLTISLTIAMRELIVSSSSAALSYSQHSDKYMSILHHIGIIYGHSLMAIARNKDIFSNDRYSAVGFNMSQSEQINFEQSHSVLDYRLYSTKRFDYLWKDLDSNFRLFLDIGQNTDSSFFSVLLGQKINLELTVESNSPTFTQPLNGLVSLELLVNSAIFELVHMQNKNLLSFNTDDVLLNLFLKNTLPNFIVSLSTMPQTLRDLVVGIMGGLSNNVLAIYIVNVCLMVVAMTASIYFFTKIIRTFRSVCLCLDELKLEDIEVRGNQLSYVISLMDLEKLNPQHIRNLSSGGDTAIKRRKTRKVDDKTKIQKDLKVNIGVTQKPSGQRKLKASSRKSQYFFTLLISMIILALFYIGQFVFSGVIVSTLVSKADKLELLYERETRILELTGLLLQYRCAALHTTIAGPTSQIRDLYFAQYNSSENKDKSRIAELVQLISRPTPYSSSDFDVFIQNSTSSVMSSNICQSVDSLTQSTSLCDLLDVQIPQKGMVQAFYHMQKMIRVWMDLLNSGGDVMALVNSPEYISHELAVAEVYHPASFFLSRRFFDYIEHTLSVDIGNVETLITISMTFVTVLSLLFTLLTFRDIFKVKEELTYTFQTVSIDGVVENQRVRVAFLRLFALDSQYFS